MRVDAGQYPGDICWHGQRRRRARRGKGGHSQLALILNLEDLLAASGRVCDVELQTDVRAQGERKGSTRVDGDGWRPNTQTDTPSISARAHSPTLANRRLRITAAGYDSSQLPAQQIKRARGSTLHEKLEWRSRAEARSFTSKDPHRQPSTPRARVLASGPCRVCCNRMPVAIRNEQLRPVSEPPRHRLARSQAAQRSVARRRRMLPAIVRAHPLPCAAGIGLAIGAGHCRGAILSPGNATVPFTPLAPARRTDLHRQRQSPTNEQAMRSRAPLQPFFYRFCLFLRRKKSEEASRIFVLSFTPLLGARCPPPGWRRCVGSASCCGTTMIT